MPTARVRASVQLRETPANNAQVTESLGAGTPVEILEDQGAWQKVQASHSAHAIPGWVVREGLAFPPADQDIFPSVKLQNGKAYVSVPRALKANDLIAWKNTAAPVVERPAWIPEPVWGRVGNAERQKIGDGIRTTLQTRQAQWDAWMTDLAAEGRQANALIEEWVATLQGGQDVWSVRAEMIYTEASQDKGHLGWVNVNDIMRWTGKAKWNEKEPKYKLWYEVVLYKSDKILKGWYKADLIEPFIYPSEENDTINEKNGESQFDRSTPMLRFPDDVEIQDAIAANRTGHQYIDVFNSLKDPKKHIIHYNLCGEFCAATLAGVNIIPFLTKWNDSAPDVDGIIRNPKMGTGLSDVKDMLSLYNLKFEEFRYTPSITPVSPTRLLKLLDEGKMIYWGVAIFKSNGKLSGSVSGDKTTRHWIVLEDVVPVGNSGWVRIYNPFHNQEEIYGYDFFIQSVGQFGIGLLVDVPR